MASVSALPEASATFSRLPGYKFIRFNPLVIFVI